MPDARIDIVVAVAALIAWVAIFMASAQGLLHVSWLVSDALLAVLAIVMACFLWRAWRRGSRKHV